MRRYRSYKFTDKHHSKGGIRSSIAGAIALVCTIVDLQFAFAHKGNAGNIVALFGTVAILGCIYGTYVGSQSFKEEECYYLFSRIGTIVMTRSALFLKVFFLPFKTYITEQTPYPFKRK